MKKKQVWLLQACYKIAKAMRTHVIAIVAIS